jgi:putative nucleotidyltransferase with HDIG domain
MSNARILIAEDSPEMREVLNTYLSIRGYEIFEAADGLEAVKALEGLKFDLIISDIKMPGTDGLSLLKKAREITPDSPFVLMTGFPNIDDAIEAIRNGAVDYITKPFRFSQIDVLLEKFLRGDRTTANKQNLSIPAEIHTTARSSEKLKRRIRELSKLHYISESISSINDEEALFKQVVLIAAQVTQAQQAYLLFRDGGSGIFYVKSSSESELESIVPEDTRAEGAALTQILHAPATVMSKGQRTLTLFLGSSYREIRSFLLAPLSLKNNLFGAIMVCHENQGIKFSKEDQLILTVLSRKMTLALENFILYQTLYMHFVNTLKALVASVEAKDQYTERHSQRVTHMAKRVASRLGCSASQLESLEFAGLLHDIGKIGVRESVLQKKGPLTEEEWHHIRKHPEVGEAIVKSLQIFPLECAIIRHHHERWDGTGYPDGLNGMNIPFLARILAVADAFDAMTSNRPYRLAKSFEEGLSELERCRETQFDPEVVDIFVELFRNEPPQGHTSFQDLKIEHKVRIIA